MTQTDGPLMVPSMGTCPSLLLARAGPEPADHRTRLSWVVISPADRALGSWWELSMRQIEVSKTRFHAMSGPASGCARKTLKAAHPSASPSQAEGESTA